MRDLREFLSGCGGGGHIQMPSFITESFINVRVLFISCAPFLVVHLNFSVQFGSVQLYSHSDSSELNATSEHCFSRKEENPL